LLIDVIIVEGARNSVNACIDHIGHLTNTLCRCGGLFCAACTKYSMKLPSLNHHDDVRVCRICFEVEVFKTTVDHLIVSELHDETMELVRMAHRLQYFSSHDNFLLPITIHGGFELITLLASATNPAVVCLSASILKNLMLKSRAYVESLLDQHVLSILRSLLSSCVGFADGNVRVTVAEENMANINALLARSTVVSSPGSLDSAARMAASVPPGAAMVSSDVSAAQIETAPQRALPVSESIIDVLQCMLVLVEDETAPRAAECRAYFAEHSASAIAVAAIQPVAPDVDESPEVADTRRRTVRELALRVVVALASVSSDARRALIIPPVLRMLVLLALEPTQAAQTLAATAFMLFADAQPSAAALLTAHGAVLPLLELQRSSSREARAAATVTLSLLARDTDARLSLAKHCALESLLAVIDACAADVDAAIAALRASNAIVSDARCHVAARIASGAGSATVTAATTGTLSGAVNIASRLLLATARALSTATTKMQRSTLADVAPWLALAREALTLIETLSKIVRYVRGKTRQTSKWLSHRTRDSDAFVTDAVRSASALVTLGGTVVNSELTAKCASIQQKLIAMK
jgi:hypothetical protein